MKKSLLIILFLYEIAFAYNFSGIDIVNIVGDYSSCNYDAIHTNYWSVSDGIDYRDFIVGDDFCADAFMGGGFVYSEVEGQKLLYDYRPCDSNVPFRLKLFFCGRLLVPQENHLWVNFYVDEHNETFDGKSIILESNRLLYGFVVDIRKIIEIGCPYGGGFVLLEDIPAGNYGIGNPYGSATLYIGTRLLCDLNADSAVDLQDIAILAEDWQKPQGKYRGDISGGEGVPDGYVDYYDLAEITDGWLD